MTGKRVTATLDTSDTAGKCPACHSEKWADFFLARNVPVDVGSLLATEAEALAAPLAEITLAHCYGCGVAWNRTFNASRIAFKPGYDAGIHHSPLVQSSVDDVVERLIKRYDLRGKNIIEIGCGSGYFLRRLCELGGNSGTGIDPTVPRVGIEPAGSGRVHFIRDFYSKRYNTLPCDFLCCQSVLEDLPTPLDFLTSVRRISGQCEIPAYFEVFNGGRAFEHQESWSIHYEQCNYFSLDAFSGLLRRCGFQVLYADTCPGNDQYIFVEATPSANVAGVSRTQVETDQLPQTLSQFAAQHVSKVTRWRAMLACGRAQHRRIVLWGSGGKGVSFLTAMGRDSGICYAIDISPSRHGRYVPGSAQQIVPPEFLVGYRPDVVILSNPAYESEIRQQLAAMELHPELWHA